MLHRASLRALRGQSVVEFALSLPFLILLLAGVVDFANAYRVYIAMTNAAREGAFEVSTTGSDANVTARVAQALSGTTSFGVSIAPITVTHTYPAASGCPGGSMVVGCPVRVTVTYASETYFAGIVNVNNIPMNAAADMVVLTKP